MLDPWIIEEIRRREEDKRRDDRPFIELPLPDQVIEEQSKPVEEESRGVIIIDLVG